LNVDWRGHFDSEQAQPTYPQLFLHRRFFAGFLYQADDICSTGGTVKNDHLIPAIGYNLHDLVCANHLIANYWFLRAGPGGRYFRHMAYGVSAYIDHCCAA
jgi:hypothetical protein